MRCVLYHASSLSSSVLSSTSNKLVLRLQGVSVLVFSSMAGLSHGNNASDSKSRKICRVPSDIFSYKHLGRGWGTSNHNCPVSYLLCWQRHVSVTVGQIQITKMYIEENYTECDHSIGAYSKFQRDLVVGWIIGIELKVHLLSRVKDWVCTGSAKKYIHN